MAGEGGVEGNGADGGKEGDREVGGDKPNLKMHAGKLGS